MRRTGRSFTPSRSPRIGSTSSPAAQATGDSRRRSIDLNADLGEGSGTDRLAEDTKLLSIVTSANIACGYHAGDAISIRETVRAAADLGVKIGAHPSFPDKTGFGRREMSIAAAELKMQVRDQIEILAEACAGAGTSLRYVKPHGALYNLAARDRETADVIADSVAGFDRDLIILGLANSAMLEAARAAGLRCAAEAFADRAYKGDGTLVPRADDGALLDDPEVIAARAVRLVERDSILSRDGTDLAVSADSLCTHGDGPNAENILRSLRAALESAGIVVAPFAR